MRKLIVEIAAASALTVAAVIALAANAHACPAMKVSGVFARASATPQAKSGAAYFVLTNESANQVRLVAISTERASGAMLHQTKTADGTAKMSEVESIDVAPGESLALSPGGMHVMLMGLTSPLKQGERIGITLTFADGCTLATDVPVGSVAQASAGGG
jgi:copper(I)-binding protein